MKFLPLLLCLLGCFQVKSFADTCTPLGGPCDTIVTTYGKTMVVEIIKRNLDEIQFYECGDTAKALNIIPLSMVKRIRPAEDPNNPVPLEYRRKALRLLLTAQLGLAVTIVGLVLFVVGAVNSFLTYGVVFLSAGGVILLACAILGWVLMRIAGRNPHFRRVLRPARWMFYLSFGPLLGWAFYWLLAFLLLVFLAVLTNG